MDITGARWGLDGAEAVLRLRALISAGDFDTYWTWHLTREHHRTHLTHYQDHTLAACPGSLQKSRTRSIRHPGTPTSCLRALSHNQGSDRSEEVDNGRAAVAGDRCPWNQQEPPLAVQPERNWTNPGAPVFAQRLSLAAV